MNEFWTDFFNFRKMVSTTIIKFVYAFGMILLNLAGIVSFFGQLLNNPAYAIVILLATVMLNLLWRICCESLILMFSIHQELVKIGRNNLVK